MLPYASLAPDLSVRCDHVSVAKQSSQPGVRSHRVTWTQFESSSLGYLECRFRV